MFSNAILEVKWTYFIFAMNILEFSFEMVWMLTMKMMMIGEWKFLLSILAFFISFLVEKEWLWTWKVGTLNMTHKDIYIYINQSTTINA